MLAASRQVMQQGVMKRPLILSSASYARGLANDASSSGFSRPPPPLYVPSSPSSSAASLLHREGENQSIVGIKRPKKTFRILSLDGGGLRGLVTAALIQRIQKQVPRFLDQVDLIAGTSGGGILALFLAHGYTPQQCQTLCQEAVKHVFKGNLYRSINPFVARYSGTEKEEWLKKQLGEKTLLSEMKHKYVLVTAVNLLEAVRTARRNQNRSWRPAVFSNLPIISSAPTSSSSLSSSNSFTAADNQVSVLEAAMRTSAAPTYFPIHHGFCDGGVISKDPGLIALSKARAHFPQYSDFGSIRVLSLGAGSGETFIEKEGKKMDWGLAQWSTRLIQLLMHSGAGTSDVLLTDMLGPHYHRLDPVMTDFIPFDALDRLDELFALAEKADMTETIDFVKSSYWCDDAHEGEEKEGAAGKRSHTNSDSSKKWMINGATISGGTGPSASHRQQQ